MPAAGLGGAAWVVAARGEFDMERWWWALRRSRSRILFLTLLRRVHDWTDVRVAAPTPRVRLVLELELTGADQVLVATLEDARTPCSPTASGADRASTGGHAGGLSHSQVSLPSVGQL